MIELQTGQPVWVFWKHHAAGYGRPLDFHKAGVVVFHDQDSGIVAVQTGWWFFRKIEFVIDRMVDVRALNESSPAPRKEVPREAGSTTRAGP